MIRRVVNKFIKKPKTKVKPANKTQVKRTVRIGGCCGRKK